MQKICILITFVFSSFIGSAQSYREDIGKLTDEVDSVLYHIYDYEKIGIKYTGTPFFDSATNWLVSRYKRFGYEPVIDSFKFRNRSTTSTNVIIEKPGTQEGKWIIIGAHYDSEINSPGANDNGSGVVATLEIARLIQKTETEIGIRIINFGAEEQGFEGSYHYVQNRLDTAEDIQLMLNLDQLGGTKGLDNSLIKCERDERSIVSSNDALSWLKTDTLANLMSLYTSLTPVISNAYSTDYIPFEEEGYVITGLYQHDRDPHNHNANDITANMDIESTTEVIKGALAATLHFSRVRSIASVKQVNSLGIKIVPNPSWTSFSIETDYGQKFDVELFNALGQVVLSSNGIHDKPIDISHLSEGLYTVSISYSDSSQKSYAKLIIADK